MSARVILGTWGRAMAADDDVIRVDHRSRSIWRGRSVVRLQPTEFAFVAALLAAGGRFVSHDEMTDILWGDRADGGPLRPILCIRQYIFYARRHLRCLGLSVSVLYGRGAMVEVGRLPIRLTAYSPSSPMVAA